MNIIYTENPLCTRIKLDEHEAKNFWNIIKMAEMEDLLFDAHFHMQDDRWNDIAAARRSVDPDYYMDEDDGTKSKLDQRVQVLYDWYMQELVSSHGGDCTCFPASCLKCHAEHKLGINTTSGMGKHMGNYIFGVFRKPEIATCSQAIALLQGNASLSDTGKLALAWLVDYQATKLTPADCSVAPLSTPSTPQQEHIMNT